VTAWLFVPGDRPDRFAKAEASGADAVICDLEDAVAPAAKPAARAAVARWLSEQHAYVRVNSAGTPWRAEDLAGIAEQPKLLGVMLPKVETAAEVHALPAGVNVVALIESAAGVQNAPAIAAAGGVERLAFGSLDFALDAGTAGSDEALLYARSRLVLASRAAGIAPPLDGITTDIDDPEITADAARRARRLGFGGKLCIHPRQVAPVAAAFALSDDEIAWAREVIDATRTSKGAAVRVGGRMVDKPGLERARRILAVARQER
jgi:citrate lyase subunit beta/citryl-CoA lyase